MRAMSAAWVMDRDLNAAINLEQWLFANGTTASSAGSNACGEGVRPGYQAVLDEAHTAGGDCPSERIPITSQPYPFHRRSYGFAQTLFFTVTSLVFFVGVVPFMARAAMLKSDPWNEEMVCVGTLATL